jgi:hypothetical protein
MKMTFIRVCQDILSAIAPFVDTHRAVLEIADVESWTHFRYMFCMNGAAALSLTVPNPS